MLQDRSLSVLPSNQGKLQYALLVLYTINAHAS